MAGTSTTNVQGAILKETSTLAAADPEPISKGILEVGTAVLGALFAAHARKVRQEASTLNGAFPAWRELVTQTVDAYNNGQISGSDAVGYVEQARQLWYSQVTGIMRGKPGSGASFAEYQQMHGKFAPIDPCNGACYISYYYVEPEAAMLKAAFASNSTQTLNFAAFNIRNGDSEPAIQLQIQPSPLSLLPASITRALPATVRAHPWLWGLGAILVLGFFFGKR